jgi:hypothetical protein
MNADAVSILLGFAKGLLSSSAFVLVLVIGFCVVVGYAKLKKTAGQDLVVKSLDERLEHKTVQYLPPTAPRGPADQLRSPELLEARPQAS